VSDRVRAMSDDELGAALAAVDVAWPATPELAGPVLARVTAQPPRIARLPMSRRTRILLVAATTALLLGGAAVAARLVIDLGAVVVEVPEGAPTLPTSSPAPVGEAISLEEAGDLLGEPVGVPAALGPPDRVWADRVVTDAGDVVRLTLAWRAGADLPAIEGSRYGAVLMRFEGETDLASKEVYEDTGTLEPVHVAGVEGVWTSGPHLLKLLTADGLVYVRVEGNVLLWPDGPYTLRLETALPRERAIRVAGTIPRST
jgi:hypothetical protein